MSLQELRDQIVDTLMSEASETGGWAYYAKKTSRIEPTCWAMLAVQASVRQLDDVHRMYLLSRQRSDGLFSDQGDLPANLSWSALALLALAVLPSPPTDVRSKLTQSIIDLGGVTVRNSPVFKQNNELKGWPWIPDTFSWVEPTSWCVLALKKTARSEPRFAKEAAARIGEGEQLLFDRVCESGGWNFGNANAFGTSLPPHVPTSAIGLLALRDKTGHPVVEKSLAFVERHWRQELSGTALALSIICLKVYGRPTSDLEGALAQQWERTGFLGNLAALAMASLALSEDPSLLNPLKVA